MKKVLLIVGSMYPMDRIVKEIDAQANKKRIEVFAQIGDSAYLPKNIKYAKFLPEEKLIEKMRWADVVITHAGAGTIILALSSKKRIILVPRLKEHGEAVDDHQIELCRAMKNKYGINFVLDEKELRKEIEKSGANIYARNKMKLASEIRRIIEL
ncbi:UDP-N-acetylglucosamine--N-acetylmuramyl-(pentapeptide) pyrophosphoryl-undecaprenol N-acetylglucosamine transferase [uncultured archaeon]|nr:UDP-N-acetylglucosamine--N-acetylmuramyl-(pentapeptide) pyrophosphoryl-undecaprenol N-acetylglucosamine transferase [uncultured archaeon]